jgi:ABC-type nitrate/sulfonate/bicarbonate transport system substrate-binding protein
MESGRLVRAAGLALALCVGLLSLTESATAQTPPTRLLRITVATGVDPTFGHYVVAVKKGFFEKMGVMAELKPFNDGNYALDALLTGDADIAATGELGGLSRIAKGGKLYVVGSGVQSNGFSAIVGTSSIASPKALEGKTIGIPGLAGGANYFFSQVVARYGIDRSRVGIKVLQAPESIAALSRGDIDAVAIWEPWVTRALQSVPGTHVIIRTSHDLAPLTSYIWVSRRFVDDKDLAERSLRAIIAASQWIPTHFDETVAVISETYHLKPDDARQIMKLVDYNVYYSAKEFQDNFLSQEAFGRSVGLFTNVPSPDSFLRPDFLRAVAPDKVH